MVNKKPKGGLTRVQEQILDKLYSHGDGVELLDLPGTKADATFLARREFVEMEREAGLDRDTYYITRKGRNYVDTVIRT